jgi:hypothetical protein
VVRASDAHSWVEAWIPGRGWCTFDPTPPDLNPPGASLLSRLAMYFDAADTFWRDWVVTYDLTRQGTLAFRLERSTRTIGSRLADRLSALRFAWEGHSGGWLPAPLRDLPRRFGLASLVGFAALIAIGFAIGPAIRWMRLRRRVERARRGQANVADATLLYHRMLHLVGRRGYQKPPWLTPAEFAGGLPRSPLGDAVAEFTAAYNALRFGGRAAEARKLSTLLDRLSRQ